MADENQTGSDSGMSDWRVHPECPDLVIDRDGEVVANVFSNEGAGHAANRARLIVESVNGRAAMAERIAELEKELEELYTDSYGPPKPDAKGGA